MKRKIVLFFLLFSLSFYGQNDTISVIKHTDKDIIVNKNSKVVYRGIPNYLSIEVPNCKSFIAFGKGLSAVSKNLYTLNPLSGSEVIIIIEITLKNNKKITEEHKFKIKNLSNVITLINNLSGEKIQLQKNQFKNAVLIVKSSDNNLNLNLVVKSFLIRLPNGKNIEIQGNIITNKAFDIIITSSSRYDLITISDIQVQSKSSFNGCIRPAPFQIEMK